MLTWIFKKLIEFYWRVVPESDRKVCLYKISCSKIVYNKLCNEGFWSGIRLYLDRKSNCKKGYSFIYSNGTVKLKTIKGLLLEEIDINPLLVSEIKTDK
jgi:putative component of membrane protein insertase Oxa1/YidC/SpoIIIJ protein YidD